MESVIEVRSRLFKKEHKRMSKLAKFQRRQLVRALTFNISALPPMRAWAVPILYLSLAVAANAQSASDFGTVQTGVKAVVALIRIIGGVVGVAALVFGSMRLFGGDMVRGMMGVFGAILSILIAANAQSIVNGFYSTTG